MSSYGGTIYTGYTGVTGDLDKRVYEHKHGINSAFTSKYHANRLVYYEATNDVHAALAREKQIKGWTRAKKVALITATNPEWRDLAPELASI